MGAALCAADFELLAGHPSRPLCMQVGPDPILGPNVETDRYVGRGLVAAAVDLCLSGPEVAGSGTEMPTSGTKLLVASEDMDLDPVASPPSQVRVVVITHVPVNEDAGPGAEPETPSLGTELLGASEAMEAAPSRCIAASTCRRRRHSRGRGCGSGRRIH